MQQIFANALISGTQIALVAVSFSIIFRSARFFHFAHAIAITCGAYFIYHALQLRLPLYFSAMVAIVLCVSLGISMDLAVYRPLRHLKASPEVLLLSSLGLYVVAQNLISLFAGDDVKVLRSGQIKEGMAIFSSRVTGVQLVSIIICALLISATLILLKYSKIGLLIRATSDSKELASLAGIDCEKTLLLSFGFSSGLAGVSGILAALDVGMSPGMGMSALLLGVIAAIIGGTSSIIGMILGSLLLGVAQHFSAYYLSSQWQNGVVFIILLAFLLFCPQGFLGKKVKKLAV